MLADGSWDFNSAFEGLMLPSYLRLIALKMLQTTIRTLFWKKSSRCVFVYSLYYLYYRQHNYNIYKVL